MGLDKGVAGFRDKLGFSTDPVDNSVDAAP
jgi:hypothetical protein